jgi:hypothetical protein
LREALLSKVVPFLIHTWLQPGVGQPAVPLETVQTVSVDFAFDYTWLKPGVNETKRQIDGRRNFEAKPNLDVGKGYVRVLY